MRLSKAAEQEEKRRSKTDIRIKQIDSARIAESLTLKGMRYLVDLIAK